MKLKIARAKRPPMSDETRQKLSLAFKGRKFTAKWRKKISAGLMGRFVSDESRKKMSESHKGIQSGRKNPSWKGRWAGYQAIHGWIRKKWGSATKCENENCLHESRRFEWSNRTGNYLRRRNDWQMLCKSCHKNYDLKHKNGIQRHLTSVEIENICPQYQKNYTMEK